MKKLKSKVSITTRVRPQLKEHLERIALQKDLTLSSFVEHIIKKWHKVIPSYLDEDHLDESEARTQENGSSTSYDSLDEQKILDQAAEIQELKNDYDNLADKYDELKVDLNTTIESLEEQLEEKDLEIDRLVNLANENSVEDLEGRNKVLAQELSRQREKTNLLRTQVAETKDMPYLELNNDERVEFSEFLLFLQGKYPDVTNSELVLAALYTGMKNEQDFWITHRLDSYFKK